MFIFKFFTSQVFYLLKWKGYPVDSNSWVKEENLNCPQLVSEFEKQHKVKVLGKKIAIFLTFTMPKMAKTRKYAKYINVVIYRCQTVGR